MSLMVKIKEFLTSSRQTPAGGPYNNEQGTVNPARPDESHEAHLEEEPEVPAGRSGPA